MNGPFWLLGVALGVLLLTRNPVAAQPRPDPAPRSSPPRNEGTQLFRGLLHHFRIAPYIRGMAHSSDTITIVMGDPGQFRDDAAQSVRDTLRAGGAVLIAADSRLDLRDFLPDRSDVRILGVEVVDPRGENSYRRNPLYPFVAPPSVGLGKAGEEEKLFEGFSNIATNRPTAIRLPPRSPSLRAVGRFPETARFREGNRFDALGPNDAFAAAGLGKKPNDTSRCLVMADPSVLSNDMLYTSADADRTENFPFALRLVPWLQGPEKRSQCLFIENGVVITKFDEFDFAQATAPPIPPIPMPKIDPLDRTFQAKASQAVSEVAGKVEDGDTYRNSFRNRGSYFGFLITLTVLLAVFAGVVLRLRIRGAISVRNYQPTPVDPLRLGREVALGSFAHRRLELLRGNDFRAPFTEYVGLLFAERGLPADYRDARCPKIEADKRNRRVLIDHVRRLWEESRTEAPLGYSHWKELEPILADVRTAAEADRWRFAPNPAA